MNITGMVHVNINCSNFERSRGFYEKLGFQLVWQVPATIPKRWLRLWACRLTGSMEG